MNRLCAYIVRWDDGFAPNPFHGVLTLACCKPEIRKPAQAGDYVVGLASKSRGNRLVYAMRVTETLTFDKYWVAPQFLVKRPDMCASGIEALGDNIYYPGPGVDGWVMVWSQHSNSDGSQNADHTRTDIGGVQALISTDFVYWGGEGPPVPESLTFQGRHLPLTFEPVARGHRVKFWDDEVKAFIKWFNRQKRGRLGMPTSPLPEPMPKPSGAGKRRKKC